MQDVTAPNVLQISVSADGRTVWVNGPDGCLFRACRIGHLQVVDDRPRVLVDTLSFDIETWDDPGDYPNGVASGPLPSYDYPVCEGELICLVGTDWESLVEVPKPFEVTKWAVSQDGPYTRVSVEECILVREYNYD